ncbi:hypothetical protein Hbut_1363 [Hyperthermus butylicus DSM 5456]|uniref:Uncharacterized protein n=2 Tax=Hyperthermus butylicus TaxID=54248 RepID=A2BMH7_HYPBU|nr:hypothetical protein Hbut_1363 [Hyperthermus butylicus DSM 5456]
MGVVAFTIVRSLLYGVAILVNAVASIIIVRRLSVHDYALYQTVMKRVTEYAARLPGLYGLWLYRYTVQGVRGAATTGFMLSLAAGLAAAAMSYTAVAQLGAPGGVAVLAALASSSAVCWAGLRLAVDAVRPLRAALLVLIQRLFYGATVILFVYMVGLGVGGAFTAATLSYTGVVVLGLFWLRGREALAWPGLRRAVGIAVEWLRKAYVTAMINIARLVQTLDVVVVYAYSDAATVAAFFAITNIFMLITEAVRASFIYLQGFVLSTQDYRSAVNAARLAALLASPLLVYAAMHPLHLVYLLNPVYYWAAPAAPLAAASSLVFMVGIGVLNLLAGLVREEPGAERRLARLYSSMLVAALTYLGVLALGLALTDTRQGNVTAWAVALLAHSITLLALVLAKAPSSIRHALAKPLAWSLLVYPGLAVPAALAFHPREPPSPRFWQTLQSLALPATGAMLLYFATVLLVDSWARTIALAAVKRARRLKLPR